MAPQADGASVAHGYDEEESPTLAVSKPLMALLAGASMPAADATRSDAPSVTAETPAPTGNAVTAPRREEEQRASAPEVSSTAAAPSAPASSEPEATASAVLVKKKSQARQRVLTASCAALAVSATLAVASWLKRHDIAPAAQEQAPRAAALPPRAEAMKSVTQAVPVAPPRPAARPLPASAAAPASAVRDDSVTVAPTCDDLLTDAEPSGKKSAGEHLRSARQALVRGDTDASQRGFCQAIRAGAVDASVALELAQLLLLRRDAAAASEWAERALRAEPNSSRALNVLGDALVRVGDRERARAAWLSASHVAASDEVAVGSFVQRSLDAAERSLKERDPARAERFLRRVLAFQPENAAATAKLGATLAKLGFPKSAEQWSRRAAELAPQLAAAP